MALQATESKFLEFVGFSCHLGSQIFDEAVFLAEAQAMAETVSLAQKQGLTVSRVNMGGGFAVNYDTGGGLATELKKYDEALARLFGGLNILIEPGRSIVAATGGQPACCCVKWNTAKKKKPIMTGSSLTPA